MGIGPGPVSLPTMRALCVSFACTAIIFSLINNQMSSSNSPTQDCVMTSEHNLFFFSLLTPFQLLFTMLIYVLKTQTETFCYLSFIIWLMFLFYILFLGCIEKFN